MCSVTASPASSPSTVTHCGPEQRQVLRAIVRCRTAELGGHVQRCSECGHQRIQYNSCRNRHCQKCQGDGPRSLVGGAASGVAAGCLISTSCLPYQRRSVPWHYRTNASCTAFLFRAAAETLREVAANPKHLGAEIGILAVLHTWGQNLMHHPHVHCVVTGGGLAPDRSHWVHGPRNRRRKKLFFAPVQILSRVFRGKFIDF